MRELLPSLCLSLSTMKRDASSQIHINIHCSHYNFFLACVGLVWIWSFTFRYNQNQYFATFSQMKVKHIVLIFSSLQFSHSVVSDSLRPHELQHARPPCPSPTPGVHSESRCIESVMPSSHLILCCPLLLLPSVFPSIRVFSNESVLHIRWPKYWSFSFSISLSSEYSGLISCRMDWLDIIAVQETLKSLLQYHSSKTSIFSTQLSL